MKKIPLIIALKGTALLALGLYLAPPFGRSRAPGGRENSLSSAPLPGASFGLDASAEETKGNAPVSNGGAAAAQSKKGVKEADADDTAAAGVPEVPKGGLSLSDASSLRDRLELLRADVIDKTKRLVLAKKAYDASKSEVEAKLARIEEERRLLDDTLQKEKKAQKERLDEALAFVAKMDPRKAASVVENMDRDLVLELFHELPVRQVKSILENVDPKKAATLMEYYTRIRSAREYELLRDLGLCQNQGGPAGSTEGNNAQDSTRPTGGSAGGGGASNPAVSAPAK